METVELESLIGLHILTGCDYNTEQIEDDWGGDFFTNCNVIRFTLDGKTYQAIENPADGYRSSMRHCIVSDTATKNVFAGVQVLGTMAIQDDSYRDRILTLIDVETGLIVMQTGTSRADNYYPSFVARFYPANMISNHTKGID